MGLFDVKKDYEQMAYAPAAQAEKPVNEFERRLEELALQEKTVYEQIGRMFVQEKKEEDVQGTPYEERFTELQTILKETEFTEKRKLASQGLRKCEHCDNVIALDSVFCNKCGAKLQNLFEQDNGKLICKKCGAEYTEDMAFCFSCGAPLKE